MNVKCTTESSRTQPMAIHFHYSLHGVEPKDFKVPFKRPKDMAFLLHESILPTPCTLLTKEVSTRQAMVGMLHTIHSLSSQNKPHGIDIVSIKLKSLTSEVRFWVTQTERESVGLRIPG